MANDDWGRPFQVGIEKPSEEPKNIDDMRKLIMEASRHSALVRSAMDAADYRGLSGEDRYAQLAYFALITLEDTHRRLMNLVNLMPMPPFVVRDEVQKEGSL